VALSPCPAAPCLLLALCRDGSLRLWDAQRGTPVAAAPRGDAFAAAMGPCGSFLLTASRSGRVHCWRPAALAAGEFCSGTQQRQERAPERQQPQQDEEQRRPTEEGLLAAWANGRGLEKEAVELPGLGPGAVEWLGFLPGEAL
jgi:hypothetical protein